MHDADCKHELCLAPPWAAKINDGGAAAVPIILHRKDIRTLTNDGTMEGWHALPNSLSGGGQNDSVCGDLRDLIL